MNSFRWLRFALVLLLLSAKERVIAQALGVNPSAAASDVRNPSSTNPSPRRPISATQAPIIHAAASQIPQPNTTSSRSAIVTAPRAKERLAPPPSSSGALSAGAEEGRSPPGKETSFLRHPLVITGEAAGGGALPLPFPTPAHAPMLMRATQARRKRDISVIFWRPGQLASSFR